MVQKRWGKKALLFTVNKYLKSKTTKSNHFQSNPVTYVFPEGLYLQNIFST